MQKLKVGDTIMAPTYASLTDPGKKLIGKVTYVGDRFIDVYWNGNEYSSTYEIRDLYYRYDPIILCEGSREV